MPVILPSFRCWEICKTHVQGVDDVETRLPVLNSMVISRTKEVVWIKIL